MQKTKWLFICLLCMAAIMMLVGCNILDSLIKDSGGSAPLGQILNKNDNNVGEDALPVVTEPQGKQTVKLYFADKNGEVLIEQSRTIPKTLSLARETVNQWLLGPAGDADCYPAVSEGTVLLDISIKNGIATVDMSKEYLQPFSNVMAETALYGLVNTVAQFSTVQLVKIRIEGQEIKTYRGLDLNQLRFRNDVIGYSSGTVSQGQESNTGSPNDTIGSNYTEQEEDAQDNNDEAPSPSSTNLFF